MVTAKGNGVRFIDGTNHPSAKDVEAAGAQGVIMYIGSPASALGKDATSAQYQDYVVAGLERLFVYELGVNDISGGYATGQQHAADAYADAKLKGISMGSPLAAAVDEHVAAANIARAVQYQSGFFTRVKQLGWFGPVGCYGFPEVTTAVHNNPTTIAQWYWGCGSLAAQPEFITIWQSNQGTVTIEGAQDDWDIEQTPIQGVSDVELTDAVISPITGKELDTVGNVLFWTNYYVNQIPALTATNAGLLAAVQALATNPAVTAAQIEQYINQAVSQHVQITGTVQVGPAPAAPTS